MSATQALTSQPRSSRPTTMVDGHWNREDVTVLPVRFDVHQIGRVMAELTQRDAAPLPIDVDGSAVEMIDLAALDALDELAAITPLWIVDPSVALRLTIEYTGRERLLDRCIVDSILAEAA